MKKGISLITLIITIIVIVILAGTIVFNIINNDVIDSANEAVIRSDMSSLKTELDMYVMEKYLAEEGYDISKLEANNERVIYDGDELEGLTISNIIPSVDSLSYKDNIVILNGKIIYTGSDSKIITILSSEQVEQNITNPEIEIQNLFPDSLFGFDEDVIITIDITDDEEISDVDLTNKIKLYNESNNVIYTDNDSEISISEVTGGLTNKQVTVTLNANSISQGAMDTLVVEKGIVKNKYNRYDLINKEVEFYIGDNPPKPLAPTFTSSTDDYTKENILLSITYTEDSVIKQYSLDGGITWLDYTEPITITENIVVLAKGINEFGSSSIEAIKDITNIDKSLPDGIFNPNSSNEVMSSRTISFNPSDNGTSGVYRWRYSISIDNGNNYGDYNAYIMGDTTSNIILDQNGINKIQVEVEDNAGNINTVTSGSYIIDTVAPIVATFSQTPTSWTNGNVSVTINYPSDAVTKQYSTNGGSTWNNYTSAVSITTNNTTIKARGIDASGNVSDEAIKNITNIDKIQPSGTFTLNSEVSWYYNSKVKFNPSDTGGSGVYRWRYRTLKEVNTSLSNLTLNSGVNIPIVSSSTLNLKTNTNYRIEFDYQTTGGNTSFYVDLWPDDLPQINPTATSVKQHYVWDNVNSSSSNMNNCNLRFFDNSVLSTNVNITNVKLYEYSAYSSYINGDTTADIDLLNKYGANKVHVHAIDNAGNGKYLYSQRYEIHQIDTGLTSVTLNGGVNVPVVTSSYLDLDPNVTYKLEFNYQAASGSTAFNVDFNPDDLPEIWPTATTTNRRYIWDNIISASSNMNNCRIRFFNNIVQPNPTNISINAIRFFAYASYTN